MEAKQKIKSYIQNNMNDFNSVEFADDDNIFEKGFVNSLFAMKLLNFVENEFNIQIDDEDIQLRNFSSISNIMRLVDTKKKR